MTIALTILGSLLLVSLFEYFGHRKLLHGGVTSLGKDHITHHKYFARDFFAENEKPAFYDMYWVRCVFGFVWSLPFALLLHVFVSWDAGLTLSLIAMGHALLWQWVHNEMHRPRTHWLVTSRWFRYIRRFHATHHGKSLTNYAFVFAPFWDKVFGTYREGKLEYDNDSTVIPCIATKPNPDDTVEWQRPDGHSRQA